jgi:hypothetical protein
VVLEQLARYGKDWHESRLPPEVRGTTVRLRVQGSSVELTLLHIYGESVVRRGSVVDAEDRRGSLVTVAAKRERRFLITLLVGIPFLAAYAVLRGGLTFALVFLLLVLVLLIAVPRAWARRANREAPLCRAILLRATQATPASGSSSVSV